MCDQLSHFFLSCKTGGNSGLGEKGTGESRGNLSEKGVRVTEGRGVENSDEEENNTGENKKVRKEKELQNIELQISKSLFFCLYPLFSF